MRPEPQKMVEVDLVADENSSPSDWDEPVLEIAENESPLIEPTNDDLELSARSDNRLSLKKIEKHDRLQGLRKILENVGYPKQPVILLDGYTKVIDLSRFIQTNLLFVKHNKGKCIEPYFLRLEDLSIVLSNMEKTTPKKRPPKENDPYNDP